MAKKASNTGKRKTRRRKSKVLDAITGGDALVILQLDAPKRHLEELWLAGLTDGDV